MFMFFVLGLCFKIDNTNKYMLYLTATFAIGIFMYIVLRQVFLKKQLLLTIILFMFFICILLMGADFFTYGDTLNRLFNEIPRELSYLYYNLKSISVNLIVPYMIVLIPIIAIIYTHNAFKGRNYISVIINIALMLIFWFWHYESVLAKYVYIYCCIGIFSFMFDGYYKVLKKYKVNLNKKISSLVSFFILSLFAVGIVYGVITNIYQSHSGIYSDLIYTKINGFDDGRFTSSSDKSHKFSGIDSITDASKEKIGGSLTVNNEPQFEVKAKRPVYLEATEKNKYDDDSNTWDNNYEKLIKIPKKEFIYNDKYVKSNKYYPEKRVYSTLKSSNVGKYNIEIEYEKSMLFHPYLTYSVNNVDTLLSPQSCIFQEGDSQSYDISYYDYGEDMTLDNAYNGGKGEGKIFKDDNGKTTFSDKEYRENKEFNEQFIGGYSNIDDRIVKLVKKIVKGSSSDAEKAYRIEQYLKNNYTYSLDVKDVDRNLLYNFLFDEKKGYCVYFATAMTIMCKIANVPAKYVEGVKMINRKNADGNYVVTDADAHAWTEVLINPEFNMWYIADATPSAAQYLYENKQYDKVNANSNIEKSNQNVDVKKQEDVKKISNNIEGKTKKKDIPAEKGTLTGKNIKYKFDFLFICIGIVLLLRIVYKRIIVKRALNCEGTLKFYSYCLNRLESIGINKPPNIGEIEFAEAIKDMEISEIVKCIAIKVYSEYYGKENKDNFDKRSFYNKFEMVIRKRQGKIKYYFFKYLG